MVEKKKDGKKCLHAMQIKDQMSNEFLNLHFSVEW